MADQNLFGVFKEEPGLASCAPYQQPQDAALIKSRTHGKQFVIPDSTQIKGSGRDTWLDKKLPIGTVPGDRYVDPINISNMLDSRGKGPFISDKPFRPTQPSARSGRAKGHAYGTFGPANTLYDTDASLGRNSGRPITAPANKLRQIYTSTPKKGGMGFPDQSRLMGGTAYTHVPDEYNRARIVEKSMKVEARARIVRPFMGGSRANGCFSSDAELYASPPPGGQHTRARSASVGRPAWRPNSPAAKGRYYGTLGTPNHYIPNPEPDTKAQRLLRPDGAAVKPFMPVSAGHKRLSMWSVNPYEREARPARDITAELL
ncbi:hypothetical protein HYH02_006042 [Chlamydomonas schloesseri]|uniref:Cilia-and flagella-associated protein 96 n=1 Tax=Chlamydomonas schloesseri TaxID=2026947 RepID=A0A836B658_9CHLO|nr:hypothetical protein HYH02_006042 [Chlamydomonas schloesseri]|eukprot:KAG2448685.1 hypothetical protein HYH02_006042 [Chlamydomonas schloesseri]